MNTAQNKKTDVLDCACQWIARLSSDQVTAEDEQAFALWLATPAHREAFDLMLSMMEQVDAAGESSAD